MIVGKGSEKALIYTADDGSRQIWPHGYGSDCGTKWDEAIAVVPCADKDGIPLADRPSWCDANWCYVDKSNCNKATTITQLFPQAGEVYWSSATCAGGTSAPGCPCVGNGQVVGAGMLEEGLVYEAAVVNTNTPTRAPTLWYQLVPVFVYRMICKFH
jgi:hypothetical protein